MRCQIFSFVLFSCSADHERDWPPFEVVFGLATKPLNVRNNSETTCPHGRCDSLTVTVFSVYGVYMYLVCNKFLLYYQVRIVSDHVL